MEGKRHVQEIADRSSGLIKNYKETLQKLYLVEFQIWHIASSLLIFFIIFNSVCHVKRIVKIE